MDYENSKKFLFYHQHLPHNKRLIQISDCLSLYKKRPAAGGAAALLLLVNEGVESLMEETCQHCRYFVQGSMTAEYIWGDCMKPGNYVPDAGNKEKRGIFTWAHKTCSDFKPRPQSQALKTENQ